MLHAEQGLGDTLQFVRYATIVAREGARVLLLVQQPLKTLLTGMEGVTAVFDDTDSLPHFDCHCPLLSLPLAFGTDLDNIPAAIPYLRADPALAGRWRGRLDGNELNVGLVWAGAARHHNPTLNQVDRRRSMQLAQLSGLADVPFVSLQKGPPPRRRAPLCRACR